MAVALRAALVSADEPAALLDAMVQARILALRLARAEEPDTTVVSGTRPGLRSGSGAERTLSG